MQAADNSIFLRNDNSWQLVTDNPIVDLIQSTSIETAKNELEAWSLISKVTTQNDKITVYCYDSALIIVIQITYLPIF